MSELHAGREHAIRAVERGAPSLPIRERHAVTVPVAAQFIGISRTRIYELLAAGEIEGRIIHGRRVVLVQSLLRLVGEAPSAKREAA
jgi:hypothetical protein